MTPEAKQLVGELRKERAAAEKKRLEDYVCMTMDKVCPECAIAIEESWCGFLWSCHMFRCPKCGREQRTYPCESIGLG